MGQTLGATGLLLPSREALLWANGDLAFLLVAARPAAAAELAAVRAPSDRRVPAMVDALDRGRRLWRNEETGLELQPSPFQPGGPPLWLGGTGPRMLRLTGTSFEGWIPLSPTPELYASGRRSVLEAAERAGRDPASIDCGVYLTVAVADSAKRAAEDLDGYIRAYYGVPAEVMGRGMAMHAGTLESAAEWFAAYRAAGARHLVVRLATPDLSEYAAATSVLLNAAR